MRYAYPVRLEALADTVIAFLPDFSDAATEGATRAEAIENAVQLLDDVILFELEAGKPLPKPSPRRGRVVVAATPSVAAKAGFILAFRDSGLSRVALGKRLGLAEGEVRRMLDPMHGTRLDRLDAAMKALGRQLVIEVTDAA